MTSRINNFFRFSAVLTALCVVGNVGAVVPQNPRSATKTNVAPQRADGVAVSRGDGGNADVSVVSRSAVRRATGTQARSGTNVVAGTGRSVARTGATQVERVPVSNARSAVAGVSRSATNARSATNMSKPGVSRASMARATAVFDDISKIGGGYSACRESYATCMDQFCAKANDTYRRCFCSARFMDFRDAEYAMDEAKTLLMQFEDNSLFAVDKTAAEVNAMYSATVGEAAIKKDTSAAAGILADINDLLTGKRKSNSSVSSGSYSSLGVLNLDFSTSADDIWSGGGAFDSVFMGGGQDMSQMEGQELYNAAHQQCARLAADSCSNAAVANMARSSYSIMITQDCNAYEKSVEAKREAVKNTVRQAERYLREARLEEYRAHNSADMNECVSKVRNAILQDTACGDNYQRCLDPTGAYVNAATGEAIYSQRLFQLTDVIKLAGMGDSSDDEWSTENDVLAQNPNFNTFLDSKRKFATTALDTCRDISEPVWEEFKRAALIEIAQAQDEKIEEVKSSCVSVMAQCYNKQSGDLKSFDDTTAKAAGAISAYAAREMCKDKVIACASLYGDTNGCSFDGNGKLTAGNNASVSGDSSAMDRCGLTALLDYVDAVDTVRVAEGCQTALESYIKDLCTPSTGDYTYPYGCRKMKLRDNSEASAKTFSYDTIEGSIKNYAINNCYNPANGLSDNATAEQRYVSLELQTRNTVQRAISDIETAMQDQLSSLCSSMDGYWVVGGNEEDDLLVTGEPLLKAFYSAVYAGERDTMAELGWGSCRENSTRTMCLAYNVGLGEDDTPVAAYNSATGECTFTESWYEQRCAWLGDGYYENGVCYLVK